jgi:hypothetical protein
MASLDPLNNPYIKAAIAQGQQQAAAQKQLADQYKSRLADIDKQASNALLSVDEQVAGLDDFIKNGRGVQWELNAQKKKIERDAKFAKINLNPEAKGASEMISILGKQYPESELAPFESTDIYKQTSQVFNRITDDYRIADIFNEQLNTLGNLIVQSKEAKDENTKKALEQQATQYAMASMAQNFANASQPNAQQLNEFLRAAPDLLTPETAGILGGNWKAIWGTAIQKLRKRDLSADEYDETSKTVMPIMEALAANPEAWYKVAQIGNKDFQSKKTKDLSERVVSKVGPHHAEVMGAIRPVVNDPLADYMAKKAQAPKQGFGMVEQPIDRSGAPTLSTGAGSTIPVQSGTMQSGTVSGGTMMPTSRPRTKFTVLTPQ